MNNAAASAEVVVLMLNAAMSVPASDVGGDWGVERRSYVDPVTGIPIWEMTKSASASDNLYFHFSNFTADNRYLVFVSPTDPAIFYVWETGGYAPQRTWLVQADGTRNRPFYARADPKTWFTPLKEWITHEAWVKDTGEMTMINDKQGVMLVSKDGSARMVGAGDYWHAAARHDGKFIVLDDAQGRIWLLETATGNTRLLATGIREGVHSVHSHPSFDRLGRYVQFHSGRLHETIALIDLNELPPVRP